MYFKTFQRQISKAFQVLMVLNSISRFFLRWIDSNQLLFVMFSNIITIGRTQYEVVMNFKEEGMSMQEKALKILKKDGEISVQK